MKVLFVGQLPKDLSFPDAIEDALCFDVSIGRIAISDGASESFDSKTWAHLLATEFIQNPEINIEWVKGLASRYASHFDFASLSWSKQAAFERGSFATLIGIENCPDHGTVDVTSVGDSFIALVDGETHVESFPYFMASEFEQRPELLSTNPSLNQFLCTPDFFTKRSITWSIADRLSPILLCMTDALGQWAISQAEKGNSMWHTLASIRQEKELEALITQERLTKNMRVDDVTLITISFEMSEPNELSIS